MNSSPLRARVVCLALGGLGLFAACGPSTDTLNLTLKERVQVASDKAARECGFRSHAAARLSAALAASSATAYLSRPGLAEGQGEALVKCIESQAALCSPQTPACAKADLVLGTLAEGAACFDDLQCATGRCAGGHVALDLNQSDVACGVCAKAASLGQACDESDTTADVLSCRWGLECAGAKCAPRVQGTAVRAAVGASCDEQFKVCEAGALCSVQNAPSVCLAVPKLGESCAALGVCQGGARCDGASALCVDGAGTLPIGVSCNVEDACVSGARCTQVQGGSARLCTKAKVVGESCTVGEDCSPGLFCGVGKKCLDVIKDLSCPLK